MSIDDFFKTSVAFFLGVLIGMFVGSNFPTKDYIAPASDLYQEQADLDLGEFREQKIKRIFIHCTATTADWSKERLLRFFRESRGWSKPGYHFYVRKNGQVDTLVQLNRDSIISWSEVAYGASGYNSTSIHVAYAGGVNSRGKTSDTRTPAQKQAIINLVDSLQSRYGDLPVYGHRFVANKGCPSFDTSKEFGDKDFRDELNMSTDSCM